jgi:hypothetical protein
LIFFAGEKCFELRLKLWEFRWEKTTGQRQTAFVSVGTRRRLRGDRRR